jgi:hypothetical protein
MLDEHAAQVRAWLEAEPDLSAQAVLARLIEAGGVLAAVKPAARRLRRWPAAMLDRGCARRR